MMLFDVVIPDATESSIKAALKAACVALGQDHEDAPEQAWYVLAMPAGEILVRGKVACTWETTGGRKTARVFGDHDEELLFSQVHGKRLEP